MKLGERGAREAGPQGEGPLPGRKRKPRKPELIAARVAEFRGRYLFSTRPNVEGVMPLNTGFFELERMRKETTAKARSKVKPKARSR